MTRRDLLAAAGAGALARGLTPPATTRFEIGCLTLPYAAFSLDRACEGIARAGCSYMGFGTQHQQVITPALDAAPAEAARVAERVRSFGLEPLLMFSRINVEAPDSVAAHLRRVDQCSAARVPYLLTFGSTRPGKYEIWIANLKQLAPRAQAAGVTLVIKPHGGNTATGRACARIVADVAEPGLRICYDAGNVLDYEKMDPIRDIQSCYKDVYAFTIKDHRLSPKDEDCGPGFGEIDHYKLLAAVAESGRDTPLLCENIFEPLVPRPKTPEEIDALARRAREFLETVARGLAI